MSAEARLAITQSPLVFFQMDACRTDLLDENWTDSNLIVLLQYLTGKGHPIELTDVRTGHRDDGPNGHFGGRAMDFWPLKTATKDDWLDANDPRFATFLADLGAFPAIRQLGLAGTADTQANRTATGLPYEQWDARATCFSDEGADHLHAGIYPA